MATCYFGSTTEGNCMHMYVYKVIQLVLPVLLLALAAFSAHTHTHTQTTGDCTISRTLTHDLTQYPTTTSKGAAQRK